MIIEEMVIAVIATGEPSIRNRHGKVAFAVHATFVAAGYVLHATNRSLFCREDALACSTTDEVGVDSWIEFENNCGFVYSNPKKGSKRVVMNIRVMNNNLLVEVLREDNFEPIYLEVHVPDYVYQTDYGSRFKNLGKLVAYVNKEIISKLDGGSLSATSWSQPSRPESILIDDPYNPYDLRRCYTHPPLPRYTVPTVHDSQPDLFHLLDPTRPESILIDDLYNPYDLRRCYTPPPPPRYTVPTVYDSQPDLFHLLDPTRPESILINDPYNPYDLSRCYTPPPPPRYTVPPVHDSQPDLFHLLDPTRLKSILIDDPYNPYDLRHCYTPPPSRYTAPTVHDSQPDLFHLLDPTRLESILIDDLYNPYDLRRCYTPPPSRYIFPTVHDSKPDLFHLLDPTRDEPYGV